MTTKKKTPDPFTVPEFPNQLEPFKEDGEKLYELWLRLIESVFGPANISIRSQLASAVQFWAAAQVMKKGREAEKIAAHVANSLKWTISFAQQESSFTRKMERRRKS